MFARLNRLTSTYPLRTIISLDCGRSKFTPEREARIGVMISSGTRRIVLTRRIDQM
jgi:hypothetical protein